MLGGCSCWRRRSPILTTVGIVLSMLFETIHFFAPRLAARFFFGHGLGSALRRGRQLRHPKASSAAAAAVGHALYLVHRMLVAVPIGLMSAIYMAEYASRRVRSLVKPLLEILAGIPTVVYGFFALSPSGPFLRDRRRHSSASTFIGHERARRRPRHGHHDHPVRLVALRRHHHRGAAVAARRLLGARRHQVGDHPPGGLPAALPGIVGAVLLAVSRAIGETMIVVMAAGLAAN